MVKNLPSFGCGSAALGSLVAIESEDLPHKAHDAHKGALTAVSQVALS